MSRLSVDSIMQGMADALPTHQKDDTGSDLASSYEAIALLVHAYLAALGFRLWGFSEQKPVPEAETLAPRLPPQWNDGFGSLSFVYKHKQSSMDFVVRVDRMGQKVEVRGLGVGDDKIYRFERVVRDVVANSSLPVRIAMGDEGEDRSGLKDKMRALFTSEDAITSLLYDLKVELIQKLIPKLQAEDYTEAEETATAERRAQEARDPNRPFSSNPQPATGPANLFPRFNPLPDMARPHPPPQGDFPPPGFEDEHEMNQPRGGLVMPGGQSPFNIGHDDLNPPGLGPHDPLRGSFIPGGGLPRPGGGSGMHPTFDDPLFAGQGGYGGPRGQGYDPQMPPGARWDPVGPGGMPRFPGGGNGRGGGNPFGGFGPGDII